jgi:hypothetical protein
MGFPKYKNGIPKGTFVVIGGVVKIVANWSSG